MNDFIRDNAISLVAAVLILGGFLLTLYVKQEITTQLGNSGIVPRSDVTALDVRVQNLEQKHEDDTDEAREDIDTIENRWNAFIDEIAAQRIDD